VRRWSGSIAEAANDEKNIADLDLLVPGLRFSTYPGYEAIANAYYDGMKAKAAVTPEVQRLAEEITRDKADTRAQAEAIFDWVSRNIRYVAVYFGSGRYVPNDTGTILSRRFGDCKDDALLLAALLAAKGIASEQVLLGADPVYRLPTTATLNAFNHVIVYIPALDLYVDPTVPFGSITRLPGSDAGKPVVRVSDKGATVARTPIPAIEDNVVEIDTRVTTTRDGGREGQTTIAARGEFSDLLRSFVARAEAGGKAAALQALAQRRGLTGTFDLDAPAWTETREPFRITTKWSTPKSAVAPGLRLPPGFSPILPHPDFFFGPFDARKRTYPAICRAGRIVHTMHLMLAGSVVNIKLPPPVKRNTPQFSFREEWSREGQYLKVRTEIVSSVAARACSPDEVQAVSTAYQTLQNRSNPVLYFARSGAGHDEPLPAAAAAAEAHPAARETRPAAATAAARETRPAAAPAAAAAAREAPRPNWLQRLFSGPAAAPAPGQAAR
jgi:transglutaminase superfamily protein